MVSGYITNLGKYNEGELIGKWIEFPINEDDFNDALKEIGVSSEPDENGIYYEEYFYTDWDVDVDGFSKPEYISLEDINELAERLECVDSTTLDAIYEANGGDVYDCLDIYESERYIFYKDCNLEYVAREFMDMDIQVYNLPDCIADKLDIDKYIEDIRDKGYCEVYGGVIAVY